MKGKVIRVNADKGFGFIKPDDGSEDVFFSFRELPKGVTVKGNEEVDFEVGTASAGKKRPAKNVKILTSALSTAPTGATEGKETKAASVASVAVAPATKPDIEVEGTLDPDSDGNFWVTVTTRKKGKLASRGFRITAPTAITVMDTNKKALDQNNLATPKEGSLQLLVNFSWHNITLTVVLDDGQKFVIHLVK